MTAKPETQRPLKKHCAYCGTEIRHGREGKIYCNVDCKNNFHAKVLASKRAKENQVFPEVIEQLKKNYRILLNYDIHELKNNTERLIEFEELYKQGFDRNVCTGVYTDPLNRLYKVCFDYKWSEYSEGIYVSLYPAKNQGL
jgi:hypothetical protein